MSAAVFLDRGINNPSIRWMSFPGIWSFSASEYSTLSIATNFAKFDNYLPTVLGLRLV